MSVFYLSPIISMTVKYLWSKSTTGSFYFKRRVPLALRQQVGKEFIQICLHTRDIKEAARLITSLVAKTNADWHYLRLPVGASTRTATREQAAALLNSYGIDHNDPTASEGFDYFQDHLDSLLSPASQEETYNSYHRGESIDLSKHLPAVAHTALLMTQGKLEILPSDCLILYQKIRPMKEQAAKTSAIPFAYLLEHLGERDIRKYRRVDANSLIQFLLKTKKVKTTTVKRYIGTLSSSWNLIIKEYELEDAKNPWKELEIPNLGDDTVERQPFTIPDYQKLYSIIGSPQDDLRAMIMLLSETGARLAEIIGLGVDDCHIGPDEQIPYIDLRERPWRTLKNKGSVRKVPLTAKALGAVQTALSLSKPSLYLFPRYVDGKRTGATAASSTLNKYIRTQGIDLTVHSFRHGMADLLRESRCTDTVRESIQGWAKLKISDKYGKGASLKIMQEELIKATSVI